MRRSGMMLMLWAAGAALSSPALAYDDPAVALCEHVAKAGVHKDHKYRRESASIDGGVAVIKYSTQALTTAPKAREYRCTFVFRQDRNGFVLLYPIALDGETCRREDDAAQAWEWKRINQGIVPGTEADRQYQLAKQAVNDCLAPHYRRLAEISEIAAAERLMEATGIYPIAPADTALSGEQKPAEQERPPPSASKNLLAALLGAGADDKRYDRTAASYVTSSTNPAALDYVICLEREVAKQPGDDLGAKVRAAEKACAKAAARLPADVSAADIVATVLECGFRPGDASPDAGC